MVLTVSLEQRTSGGPELTAIPSSHDHSHSPYWLPWASALESGYGDRNPGGRARIFSNFSRDRARRAKPVKFCVSVPQIATEQTTPEPVRILEWSTGALRAPVHPATGLPTDRKQPTRSAATLAASSGHRALCPTTGRSPGCRPAQVSARKRDRQPYPRGRHELRRVRGLSGRQRRSALPGLV